MSSSSIWHYFQLVRLPNFFTVPSNVLVGYLALHDKLGLDLIALVSGSIMLYASGIVFNDYFDYEHDKNARRNRPLASGKIARKNALVMAVVLMAAGNLAAFLAGGFATLFVSSLISVAIIAYDTNLKSRRLAGTVTMASARSLNIILGASASIPTLISTASLEQTGVQILSVASLSMFSYIASIMILSRNEEAGTSSYARRALLAIVLSIIVGITIIGYSLAWNLWFVVFIVALAAVILYSFIRHHSDSPNATQMIIRNMILSIVILDSLFLTASSGIFYGLAITPLIIPAMIIGKKMYLT